MSGILHITLEEVNVETARLRYFRENRNDFRECTLDLKSIHALIDRAEAYYYVRRAWMDTVATGQQLYHWLDGQDRFLDRAIEEYRGRTEALALAIAAQGKLAHLPWEVLHDGDRFFVERSNPAVVPLRWIDQGKSSSPLRNSPANRPLSVLFMATDPLNVKPKLDFEREEGLILAATKKQPLTLTVEESGNLEELRNIVASYEKDYFDVFHLTGHATLSEDGARFVTETETGDAHYAAAKELARALKRMPGLLFLSGCHTGAAANAGSVPSLAEELLRLGAKAVLGWGRPVRDDQASQAAAVLYGALAEADELMEALAGTYQTLIDHEVEDWHLLRLYVAGEMPGALVTPLKTPGRKQAARISRTAKFLDEQRQQVKVASRESFVGRRRPLLQRCLRALRYDNGKTGVLLWGMGGVGKSTLAARLGDSFWRTNGGILTPRWPICKSRWRSWNGSNPPMRKR